jgi:hypothetical protein
MQFQSTYLTFLTINLFTFRLLTAPRIPQLSSHEAAIENQINKASPNRLEI